MHYQPRIPPPPVGDFVETVFHLKDYQPEHPLERLVPDGSINLVLELDGQRRWIADNQTLQPIQTCQHSWISGIHTGYLSISALKHSELLGIRFRPGGFFPLIQQPVDQFTDQVIDGQQVLGGALRPLRENLLNQDTSDEKLDVVQAWLLETINPQRVAPVAIRHAVTSIQSEPTVGRLDELVHQSGYSRKQFVHLFKKHIGIPPKSLQRILRFNRVLTLVQQESPVDWASLSVDCGYFDQAHFVKDFQHFCGINPTAFLQIHADRVNFFPLDEDPAPPR